MQGVSATSAGDRTRPKQTIEAVISGLKRPDNVDECLNLLKIQQIELDRARKDNEELRTELINMLNTLSSKPSKYQEVAELKADLKRMYEMYLQAKDEINIALNWASAQIVKYRYK